MGNCACSCSFNHGGYSTTYDEVTIKEKVLIESPRKLGANFLGTTHRLPSVEGGGQQRGSGKLLLTPGFLHFWQVMTNVYFRLNLADATNVEFRTKYKRRRPLGVGKIIVVSFTDETGRANEVGFLVLPAAQTTWLQALRRETLNAGGSVRVHAGAIAGGGLQLSNVFSAGVSVSVSMGGGGMNGGGEDESLRRARIGARSPGRARGRDSRGSHRHATRV